MLFISGKVIDYCVSDYRFGLEDKSQGQIYLGSMLWLGAQISHSFSSKGVNISHNNCLCYMTGENPVS